MTKGDVLMTLSMLTAVRRLTHNERVQTEADVGRRNNQVKVLDQAHMV
jgi:hypothetical protein